VDDYSQAASEDLLSLWPFVASAASGLVLGLERRHADAAVGLKGFVLIALFGTLIALVAETSGSAVIIAAGVLVIGAAGAAAVWTRPASSRGLLTVVAAAWTFGLGAATWYGYTQAALLLAVASAVLLRLSAPQGTWAARWSASDIATTFQLLVLALALLPLAADQEYGPYGAVNPFNVWLATAATAALSWLGFAAPRLTPRRPPGWLAALAAGAASCTTVTWINARAAQTDPACVRQAATVTGTACLAALVRVAVVAAVSMPRFWAAVGVIAATAVLLVMPVAAVRWRHHGEAPDTSAPPSPPGIGRALGFALSYAASLVIAAWASDAAGRAALVALALFTGFAPAGAAGLAALHLGAVGDVTVSAALVAFAAALISLVCWQGLVAYRMGGARFARQCLPLMALAAAGIVAGTAIALALVPVAR